MGLFGQASRLVSTMFGANKKGKEPIKSITLATAAAKKVSPRQQPFDDDAHQFSHYSNKERQRRKPRGSKRWSTDDNSLSSERLMKRKHVSRRKSARPRRTPSDGSVNARSIPRNDH